MIDDERAAGWAKEAITALMRSLDNNYEVAHLASITLTLLADREVRERYISEHR